MAAFIALGITLGENTGDIISSFLYRSTSEAATCSGSDSDIADLTDVVLAAITWRVPFDYQRRMLYAESMEMPFGPIL